MVGGIGKRKHPDRQRQYREPAHGIHDQAPAGVLDHPGDGLQGIQHSGAGLAVDDADVGDGRILGQGHGHPDRVYLENLRWDFIDPTGRSALRGWVWDKVYWEYRDGRRVLYPSYAEFQSLDTTGLKPVDADQTEMDRSAGNVLPGRA